MLISQALAAHFAPASETSGGADTFSIILIAGAVAGLAYYLFCRWRRGRPNSEHGSDYDEE
ncbi:MAG: hypothetical protein O7C66_02885 [Alphaproteobacteria bacterium]|nr:hypothetical protein [Alphaproteobacteria bacterium]